MGVSCMPGTGNAPMTTTVASGNALEELEDAFWTESLSVCACRNQRSGQISVDKDRHLPIPRAISKLLVWRVCLKDHGDYPRRSVPTGQELLEGRWPQELSKMQSVLSADANDALHTIRVVPQWGTPVDPGGKPNCVEN